VDAAFGDKTLQKMVIYTIIKKVKAGENTSDQRHLNGKKTIRNAALITSVASTIEQDRRLSMKSFAVAYGVGVGTITYSLRGFGPRKKVYPLGTQTAVAGAENSACGGLQGIRRRHPPPLVRNARKHRHHGRNNDIVSHA
jgi:hypothetical protein